MIELKTEKGSHRRGQVPSEDARGAYHLALLGGERLLRRAVQPGPDGLWVSG